MVQTMDDRYWQSLILILVNGMLVAVAFSLCDLIPKQKNISTRIQSILANNFNIFSSSSLQEDIVHFQ